MVALLRINYGNNHSVLRGYFAHQLFEFETDATSALCDGYSIDAWLEGQKLDELSYFFQEVV